MHPEPNKQNPDQPNQLYEALKGSTPQEVIKLLDTMHPSAIANALETMPRDIRPDLWQLVATPSKGEVLLETHGEVRQQLIAATDEQVLLTALAILEIDELADLDADLPVSVVNAMVEAMVPNGVQMTLQAVDVLPGIPFYELHRLRLLKSCCLSWVLVDCSLTGER